MDITTVTSSTGLWSRHVDSGVKVYKVVCPSRVWNHSMKENCRPEKFSVWRWIRVQLWDLPGGTHQSQLVWWICSSPSDTTSLYLPAERPSYWVGMMGKDNAPFSAQLLMNCSAVVELCSSYSCTWAGRSAPRFPEPLRGRRCVQVTWGEADQDHFGKSLSFTTDTLRLTDWTNITKAWF